MSDDHDSVGVTATGDQLDSFDQLLGQAARVSNVSPTGSKKRGADLQPGAMVGGYRIERVIGVGGMGTVYAVVHPIIGKVGAAKVCSWRSVLRAAPSETSMRGRPRAAKR